MSDGFWVGAAAGFAAVSCVLAWFGVAETADIVRYHVVRWTNWLLGED